MVEKGCAGLLYPHILSVSLGDVSMGALPKPKELLSVLISMRLSVAVAALFSGATCVHPAWAQKQRLLRWLSWHLDVWTWEISGHLSKWGFMLQCLKARGVRICLMHQLEQHSFPCCLEMSPQKGVENGFFKCHHQNSPPRPPPRFHPCSSCLCSHPLS